MPFRPRTLDGIDLPADYSVTQHGPSDYRLFTPDYETHTFTTADACRRFAWQHAAGDADDTTAVTSKALTLVKSKAPVPAAEPEQTAYDLDVREIVPVRSDKVRRFQFLHQRVQMAVLVVAAALREIADDKLYLAQGFASFKQYTTSLDMAEVTAKKYVQIGRRFAPMLPRLSDGEALSEDAEAVSKLGFTKLLGLARADEETREELIADQQLTGADGTVYTIEEIKAMGNKEYYDLLQEVGEERKAHRERFAQMDQQIKLLESERDSDQQRIDDANAKLQSALDLERLYGDQDLSYEQQGKALTASRDALKELRRQLMNTGVTPQSAAAHVNDAVDLVRELALLYYDAQDAYGYLVQLADAKYRSHTDDRVQTDLDRLEGEVVA